MPCTAPDRSRRCCAVAAIALLVVAGLVLSASQPSTQARRPADVPQLDVREDHAAERPRGDPQPEARAADGGREPLVPRRPRQRGGRPHRVRAPLRAHDVPELEARARGLALQAARGRRRQRHQRHDRLRPHQLLRDRAVEPARARAVARVGSHGLPAREGRRRRRSPTSRTSCATSAARAWRTSRTASPKKPRCSRCSRRAIPYYGNVIGSHEDIQAAKLDDVQRVLPPVLRARTTPRSPSSATSTPAQAKALVDKYFGTLKRGPAVPRRQGDDAEDHGRAPPGRAGARRSCRASRWRGSRRRSSSRATPTPTSPRRSSAAAVRAACTRSWSTRSRSRRTSRASQQSLHARLDVPDRGDRAPRPHRRGAREGDRRGAGRVPRRRRRPRQSSSARATRSRPTSSAASSGWAGSAASPIG